jgi:hypothetical protein
MYTIVVASFVALWVYVIYSTSTLPAPAPAVIYTPMQGNTSIQEKAPPALKP